MSILLNSEWTPFWVCNWHLCVASLPSQHFSVVLLQTSARHAPSQSKTSWSYWQTSRGQAPHGSITQLCLWTYWFPQAKSHAFRLLWAPGGLTQMGRRTFRADAGVCISQRGAACLSHTRAPSFVIAIRSRSTSDTRLSYSRCSEGTAPHSHFWRAELSRESSDLYSFGRRDTSGSPCTACIRWSGAFCSRSWIQHRIRRDR